MEDPNGDETEDKRKTKRKAQSTASLCHMSQRELRLCLSGVDESLTGEALLLSNASQGRSVRRGSKCTILKENQRSWAHSGAAGSRRWAPERTLRLERFPSIVKL